MEIFDRPMPSDDAHRTGDIAYRRSLDDTVDVREVLAKLWTRKRLIFASVLICAGLAFVMAKSTTPAYTAEALVMIKPQQPMPATVDTLRAALQGGILASPEAVQTEAFVLQSRPLASNTITRLHLDQDPEFDPSLRKPNPILTLFNPVVALFDEVQNRLWSVAGFLSGQADAPMDGDETGVEVKAGEPSAVVVDNFAKRLRVAVQERSNVIQVSFSSSHPATAALVPNTLIGIYLEQRARAREKAVAQEKERLENVVLPALRQKMQASELALEEYRQKSGLASEQNPTVLAQQLSQTEAQLTVARAHKAEAVARLSQIQASAPSMSGTASAGAASESPILQRLKEQEVGLEAQLSAVRGSLGPDHPKTLQLEAQLKKVEDGMRHESAGFVGRLKAELAAAQATEVSLNKRMAEFTHQFAQVNGADSRLQSLMVQAEADRKTYAQYLATSNEAYTSIAHPEPDASLLSNADVPVKPAFPSIRMMVMIGIAIGAGAGIILALMIDRLRSGLRSKEQVEQELGIRCLGLVPKLERFRSKRLRLPQPQRGNGAATLLQPQQTAFGQAIRSVELKLLSFDRRLDSRVVLVTAALPDEGKTWVAASLAASLTADGFSVALVDCDLYRPTLHRMFDGVRGPGLTDYFAGEVAFEDVVHSHPLSGVSYVPVGTAQAKDAWRITSTRLRPLVDRLKDKYAFVILDSPPVLAVSETILLSQIAQRTILVVKWGSTPPAIARHAVIQLLESNGAKVAALLSMVDARRAAKFGDPVAGAYKKLETYYGH
jgi:uncharacterized protein involved in exopolysaccharide biosynthesis/Mrp family chromosome partitioning ATPase